jgi:hypothetical protein
VHTQPARPHITIIIIMLGIVSSFYCPGSVAHVNPLHTTVVASLFEDIIVVVHMGMFTSFALARRGIWGKTQTITYHALFRSLMLVSVHEVVNGTIYRCCILFGAL